MPKEFYAEIATGKSREILQRLSQELDFVLVGGWAVNFYVKTQKSTDVDIVISADKLEHFKKYGVEEYENMAMFFSRIDGVVVDLLVEGITDKDLTVPLSKVLLEHVVIEGIKTASKSILLLLKMCGYFSSDSQKIEKDIVDVVSMLFYSGVDLREVASYIKEYDIDNRKGFSGMLEYIDKGKNLWEFITTSPNEYEMLSFETKKRISEYFH